MNREDIIFPDIIDRFKNYKTMETISNMNEFHKTQPLEYIEPDTDLMFFIKIIVNEVNLHQNESY